MDLIGTVVRLQVQSAPLKPRPSGSGRYDPAPLREVSALAVNPDGCDGDGIVDVHHAAHPQSRHVRGRNGLSLLAVGHYTELRERYGDHLADGTAGENVLLDTAGRLTADDLRDTLLLETDGEPLQLTEVLVAAPCLEFSRFCAGRDVGDDGPEVQAALEHLSHGTRGFYLRVTGNGVVRRGARLLRP